MKLLYCPKCGEIFSLSKAEEKTCRCRLDSAAGRIYMDGTIDYYNGIPLEFDKGDFLESIRNAQSEFSGGDCTFTAQVITKDNATWRKRSDK